MKRLIFKPLIAACGLLWGVANASSDVIDVHVIYSEKLDAPDSPYTKDEDVRTFISSQINYANKVLTNSNAGVSIKTKSIESTSIDIEASGDYFNFFKDTIYASHTDTCTTPMYCVEYLVQAIKKEAQADYLIVVGEPFVEIIEDDEGNRIEQPPVCGKANKLTS